MINQMTIIGLGFIGKSIACAIQSAYFTRKIVGYDDDVKKAEGLANKKIIDQASTDLISAVKNADLIVITTPLDKYEQIFDILVEHIKDTATITDIASIKLNVVELARKKLGKHFNQFVPSHPITSVYKPDKASPMLDIFAERPVILTPTPKTRRKSISVVKKLWQKMGGEIEIKSAAENDAILANVSHLPQMLAFTFINGLNGDYANLRYITKNFKDFTSLAVQSPFRWRDMNDANREAIIKELTKFEANLQKIKKILETENIDSLLEQLMNAKELRKSN